MPKRPTPGFNRTLAINGIHEAMNFGTPNNVADRATFCWTETEVSEDTDGDGIPFAVEQAPASTSRRVQAMCAVEIGAVSNDLDRLGPWDPDRMTITMLDPDYQPVKPFEFVVYGGTRYNRKKTTVIALGTVDVWTIECEASDGS